MDALPAPRIRISPDSTPRYSEGMTALDVCYRYGMPPTERELRAINSVRNVYGIRRVAFDEHNRTVTVEYDGTRLTEAAVAALLRDAGLDLTEKIALV